MPLPNRRSRVAVLLEKCGHGEPSGGDERWVVGAIEHACLQPRPPRITPREQSIAGGRADGGAAVRIGKRHALQREFVEVRCLDFPALRIEALHIAIAEIVGEDVNDVGLS